MLNVLRTKASQLLAISVLFVSLSGCAAILPAGIFYLIGGVTVASLVTVKKLPTDVISDIDTGLDCDLTRSVSKGVEYCTEPDYLKERNVSYDRYCYRSLGAISCYKEPNPFLDETIEVGSSPVVVSNTNNTSTTTADGGSAASSAAGGGTSSVSETR